MSDQKPTDIGASQADTLNRAQIRRENDERLVAAVKVGDAETFGRLFDDWVDPVHDRLVRQNLGEDDVVDAEAKVFQAAWRELSRGRIGGSFGAGVMRSALREAQRRRRPTTGGAGAEEKLTRATNLEATAGDPAVVGLLFEAAESLGQKAREVLDLHFRHGLTSSEIGEVLGTGDADVATLVRKLPAAYEAVVRCRILWCGGSPEDEGLAQALAEAEVTGWGPDAVRVITREVKASDKLRGRSMIPLGALALFRAVPMAAPDKTRTEQIAARLVATGVPLGRSQVSIKAARAGGLSAAAVAAAAEALSKEQAKDGGTAPTKEEHVEQASKDAAGLEERHDEVAVDEGGVVVAGLAAGAEPAVDASETLEAAAETSGVEVRSDGDGATGSGAAGTRQDDDDSSGVAATPRGAGGLTGAAAAAAVAAGATVDSAEADEKATAVDVVTTGDDAGKGAAAKGSGDAGKGAAATEGSTKGSGGAAAKGSGGADDAKGKGGAAKSASAKSASAKSASAKGSGGADDAKGKGGTGTAALAAGAGAAAVKGSAAKGGPVKDKARPVPGPAPTSDEDGSGARKGLIAAAIVVAILIVAGIAFALSSGSGDEEDVAAGGSTTTLKRSTTTKPETTTTTSASTTTATSEATTTSVPVTTATTAVVAPTTSVTVLPVPTTAPIVTVPVPTTKPTPVVQQNFGILGESRIKTGFDMGAKNAPKLTWDLQVPGFDFTSVITGPDDQVISTAPKGAPIGLCPNNISGTTCNATPGTYRYTSTVTPSGYSPNIAFRDLTLTID